MSVLKFLILDNDHDLSYANMVNLGLSHRWQQKFPRLYSLRVLGRIQIKDNEGSTKENIVGITMNRNGQ